ncbi:hypothetical protein [Antrihabitans stalactiti]|uniref:Uncharacterized protein n=1 Tax=Antrihabitans stalactiti TaxID=2584121 RepID=A0A848KFJ3_9NOCA|nr:hypothetical protein [Antrihabitans stalactiti]
MTGHDSFARLSREELAVLLPELLLCGHLIDRSGMAHSIGAFGREGMTQVAIEEWQVASPVYTKRMQKALGFEGDSVETIFKGLQFDIGAPPQFMDFRFRVDDHDSGEFWLDHCGALMDVEPMGEEFVVAMCHDIEDPTFDATALATNKFAQVRPIHRPPRLPSAQGPHCAWTVKIDPSHIPPDVPPNFDRVLESAAATVELQPIDPADEGNSNYSGTLLSDIRFADFSRSTLIRLAEEVCLQQHLLTIGFLIAVRSRTDEKATLAIGRKQFAGIAGLTSERIRKALRLGDDLEALATVLELHPALNPRAYVAVSIEKSSVLTLRIGRDCGAFTDGTWPTMISGEDLAPLNALVRGVNPQFDTRVAQSDSSGTTFEIALADKPFREAVEVAITRFSTGADFSFVDRGKPLPLIVL